MSPRRSAPPAAVTGDPVVAAALQAVTDTEAAGQNLTDEQYATLRAAVDGVLATTPELASFPSLRPLALNLAERSDRGLAAWIVTGDLLRTHRGAIDAPSGEHGPWPGSRCVYCGSNNLDVDLYTVDPRVCPPLWACGADHPDRGAVADTDPRWIAHCGLVPGHAGDHRYEYFRWAEAFDPGAADRERAEAAEFGWAVDEHTVGWVTAAGPPQLVLITWPRGSEDHQGTRE